MGDQPIRFAEEDCQGVSDNWVHLGMRSGIRAVITFVRSSMSSIFYFCQEGGKGSSDIG